MNEYYEVNFEKYCKKCEHEKVKEVEEPCEECLAFYFNENSDRPVHYKEKRK